ncbi:hypothetical protein GYA49_03480 [Candidatus Beckwithbacteria bacterium]|nr:hypothetical protein [Candidatus Beckwithbacteria bacterium]
MLDFLLIFILSFFFTQGNVWVKASTFNIKLFPLYFVLIIVFLYLDLNKKQLNRKLYTYGKIAIFSLLVLLTVGKSFYTAINLRHQLGNSYPVHDNPIQLEEAIKYLKQGKNPYTQDYFGTAQEAWYQEERLNRALYHFVTLPFYPLFSLILSYPTETIFGFFDERMVHGLIFLIPIYLIWKLFKNLDKKILYLTLFIFNPIFIHFFIEGRNDIFVFAWVFLSLYLLYKRKILASSAILGLAIASKQSSWLLLPFYFFYLWQIYQNQEILEKVKSIFLKTWPFFVLTLIFFGSFLLWDGRSFVEDVYLFPGGGLATSYFITGIGISELLLETGFIASDTAYFPFFVLQLIVGLPLLIFLFIWFKKRLTISSLVFAYGIFLTVFWLFSRFFMDNYVGYLTMVFLIGAVFLEAEKSNCAHKNKLVSKKTRI